MFTEKRLLFCRNLRGKLVQKHPYQLISFLILHVDLVGTTQAPQFFVRSGIVKLSFLFGFEMLLVFEASEVFFVLFYQDISLMQYGIPEFCQIMPGIFLRELNVVSDGVCFVGYLMTLAQLDLFSIALAYEMLLFRTPNPTLLVFLILLLIVCFSCRTRS